MLVLHLIMYMLILLLLVSLVMAVDQEAVVEARILALAEELEAVEVDA